MFVYRCDLAPKWRAHWTIAANLAAFTPALAILAVLSACGGSPRGAANQPVNLTVSSNLPAGMEGSVYNGQIQASGGTAPYNFAITSGQMPQGVNLDQASGDVTGTPASSGSFTFGVTVSDARGASRQDSLEITIAQAAATSSPVPTSPPPSSPAPPSTPPPSAPAPSSGNSFSTVQHAGGGQQYGQGPPDFVDCSPSPCNRIDFSMTQGSSSPSVSGKSTVFWLGGTKPYSDALWNNHLIGPNSSQGIFDTDQSKTSSLHDFTYDVDFYGDHLELSEALEFDINQFFGNKGFVFGHECVMANEDQWKIWDESKHEWVPTGIPCHPKSGEWNHLTLKVHRTSDDHTKYESITLNGKTSTLNWTFENGSSPGWYGVVVNFQMDGYYKQVSYKVYLDNLNITYQ